MPTTFPSWTTGRCRKPFSYITSSAVAEGLFRAIVCGPGVITSASRVVRASSPFATTRNTMSRSVQIPTRQSSAMTMTAPTLLLTMSLAALPTGVSGGALRTFSRRIMSLTGRSNMALPQSWT